jgi:hypothetical protein
VSGTLRFDRRFLGGALRLVAGGLLGGFARPSRLFGGPPFGYPDFSRRDDRLPRRLAIGEVRVIHLRLITLDRRALGVCGGLLTFD